MTEQYSPSPSEKFRQLTADFLDLIAITISRRHFEKEFTDNEVQLATQREQHDQELERKAKAAVGTYSVNTVRYDALSGRYRIRADIIVGSESIEIPYEVLEKNIHWIPNGTGTQSLTISPDHQFSAVLWERNYSDGERIVFPRGRRN